MTARSYEFKSRSGDYLIQKAKIAFPVFLFILYYRQVGHQAEQGHVPAIEPEADLWQFLCKGLVLSILSIHIDESGNLNLSNRQNPTYCLAMVFHNQDDDISTELQSLNKRLSDINCDVPFIHTSPLIRQDEPFAHLSGYERKKIFRAFARFVELLPIIYTTFQVTKTFYQDNKQIEVAFEHQIWNFIEERLEYFQGFEKIVVYYDCGQSFISRILRDTLGKIFGNRMDFRTAYQKDYRLLQVADYICTLEQSKIRWDNDNPTKSEQVFFLSRQKFLQNYYRKMIKKHL